MMGNDVSLLKLMKEALDVDVWENIVANTSSFFEEKGQNSTQWNNKVTRNL